MLKSFYTSDAHGVGDGELVELFGWLSNRRDHGNHDVGRQHYPALRVWDEMCSISSSASLIGRNTAVWASMVGPPAGAT